MKLLPPRRPFTSPEILEARIAPAAVLTFTDTDGDLVTVSASKGTGTDLHAVVDPFLVPAGAGRQLQQLALNTRAATFQGATIVISAAGSGNGTVDIGYINATGLDLGSVTIDGDLGQIDAGDADTRTQAVCSLSAGSIGVRGLDTQAAGGILQSTLVGRLGALTLAGNLQGASLLVLGSAFDPDPNVHDRFDTPGSIGAIDIGGSLLGAASAKSGSIEAKGAIGNVHIGGNIAGGVARESGRIFSEDRIAAVRVDGSIVGGANVAAQESGQVFGAGGIASVVVKQSLLGGDATRSGFIGAVRGIGSVSIGVDVRGGRDDDSGAIGCLGVLGRVTIGHDLVGGGGTRSGTIQCADRIPTVSVGHDIQGGDGLLSGVIGSAKTIGSTFVGGSIRGGAGPQSGAVGSFLALGAVHVVGDVAGGTGGSSGQIVSISKIASVTIDGSLLGGIGFESGAIGTNTGLGPIKIGGDLRAGQGDRSGAIIGDSTSDTPTTIASVTIGGSLNGLPSSAPRFSAGPGSGGGGPTPGFEAGTIFSDGAIGSVIIEGDVVGGDLTETGSIRAATIQSITIRGNLTGGGGSSSGILRGGTSIGAVHIDGFLQGGAGADSGQVFGGSIQSVFVGRNLRGGSGALSGGIVSSAGDIGAVEVRGSLLVGSATLSGFISSAGTLGSVKAATFAGNPSHRLLISAATSIGAITVANQVVDTDIFAGVATGSAPANPHAQIGTIVVGTTGAGNVIGTNIVAGAAPGEDGVFGTADDFAAPTSPGDTSTTLSRIASVIVKGSILFEDSTAFGIVAQHIVAVKVAGTAIKLKTGPTNDGLIPLPGRDTSLNELVSD